MVKKKTMLVIIAFIFILSSCTPTLPKIGDTLTICRLCNHENGVVYYKNKAYPVVQTSTGSYFELGKMKVLLYDKMQKK